MKKTIIVFFFLFKIILLSGQLTHSVSLGPELGFPSKNFGTGAGTGIGGSLEYQAKFKIPIGIQLHAGFTSFGSKGIISDVLQFIPLRIGFVGFVYEDMFFISADAGVSFLNVPDHTDYTKSGFSFGIGAGYKLYFNPDKKQFLQLSAYYNSHKYKDDRYGQDYNYTWFNLRAAYGLSFGKKPIEK